MPSIWRQFIQREANPYIQFIKYGLAGGAATVVHVTLFYLLAWLIVPALEQNDLIVKIFRLTPQPISDATRATHAMIDNGVAFIFSNLTAYLLNIVWVFEPGRRHKAVEWTLCALHWDRHPRLSAIVHRSVEVVLFYLVSGIAIVIGTFLMGILIRYFGITTTVAFGAELIAAALINFALRKYLIFKG